MKTQVNVRLSEASIEKLTHLEARYGTQTTALEVAIECLYEKEIAMTRGTNFRGAMSQEDVMPSKNRWTDVYVQKGSSSDLRVSDESKFYVVKQERAGSQILDTSILKSFTKENDANKYRDDWKSKHSA